MATFDITSEAKEDLYMIWDYTADTWSEQQADRYYSILVSSFNKIAADPLNIGKPFDEIVPGLRAYHVRCHMVFYATQSNERVLIVRILHEKMDYPKHLNP